MGYSRKPRRGGRRQRDAILQHNIIADIGAGRDADHAAAALFGPVDRRLECDRIIDIIIAAGTEPADIHVAGKNTLKATGLIGGHAVGANEDRVVVMLVRIRRPAKRAAATVILGMMVENDDIHVGEIVRILDTAQFGQSWETVLRSKRRVGIVGGSARGAFGQRIGTRADETAKHKLEEIAPFQNVFIQHTHRS